MAIVTWSLPSFDPKYVFLLQFFLPLIIAFLPFRLIYSWVSKPGWQAAGFSPTLASILSTPILALPCFCFFLARMYVIRYPTIPTIQNVFHALISSIGIFAPVFLILLLLAVYLRRVVCERSRASNILFSAATVACLLLQFLWFYILAGLAES
jgi:hypothetical protein